MSKLFKSLTDWVKINYIFRAEYLYDKNDMKKTKKNMWENLYWFNKPIKYWCSISGIYTFWKFIIFSNKQINFDNKYGISRYYLEDTPDGDKNCQNPYIWNYKKLNKYSKYDWTNDADLKDQKKFLEEKFNFILTNFKCLNNKMELHPENKTSLNMGSWKRISIYDIKGWNNENIEFEKLLTKNFNISTSHGLVFFSQTGPNTEIKSHFGSTNLRLRMHLGLSIPENTGLVVKGKTLKWEEGKVLIFDDSYYHSSYNKSKNKRIIFIIDIYNPHLNANEIKILNYSVMKNLGKL